MLTHGQHDDFCDKQFNTKIDLRSHVKEHHCTSKGTQSDTTETDIKPFDSYGTTMNPFKCVNFTEYSCHYCQKIILSNDDLEKHKPVCYTIEDLKCLWCPMPKKYQLKYCQVNR